MLTANQIELIDLIIDHLTERGVFEPRRLQESPFTRLDYQGVNGLFPQDTIKRFINVLADVRKRAVV